MRIIPKVIKLLIYICMELFKYTQKNIQFMVIIHFFLKIIKHKDCNIHINVIRKHIYGVIFISIFLSDNISLGIIFWVFFFGLFSLHSIFEKYLNTCLFLLTYLKTLY